MNQSTPSYSSIVAGGDNATILHYHKNNSIIKSGELVLIDAGCEINGYASDITRTWPVNGKFSAPQKEIYELVLKAQTDAIAECRAGKHWSDPTKRLSLPSLMDWWNSNIDLQCFRGFGQ